MFNKLNTYINDNEFRLTLYNNKLHIINLKRIITLESNYISILSNNKKINITGSNLVLQKLLEEEMLIKGNISKIEVIND